jgi:diguanylate cyclase (GGDEF)-like protein/PAS domain S-box-containing protein
MLHVGVLSPVTGGFFFGEVLAGVVREVSAAGGRVTLVQTLDAGRAAESFSSAPNVSAPAGWQDLDGFIAIAWAVSEDYLRRLRASGKPLVLISNDLRLDAAMVVVDNDTAVREAVEHLIGHGHRRILYVGNLGQTDMAERYASYCAVLAEHGLTPAHVGAEDHIEGGGAGAAPEVLAHVRDGVTAVVCSTDRVALGLIDALRPEGVRVPDDLAVVGFDDVEAGWTFDPPLATVNQEFAAQGEYAARLLLGELRGEPAEHRRHSIPATFLPRASCGCRHNAATTQAGERAGEALVAEIVDHLGITPGPEPRRVDLASIDVAALDEAIDRAVERVPVRREPPENRRGLVSTCVRRFVQYVHDLREAGVEADDVVEHCIAQLVDSLLARHTADSLHRIERLTVSLAEQYDVGLAMLGEIEDDPAELGWLSRVPVRAGCLGMWEGAPSDGVLRIRGVYDPSGSLDHLRGTTVRFEEFPPLEVTEVDGAAPDDVSYVVPVRGSTGDHGMLCVVGPIDTEFGSGRATHNHWAALLGAALRESRLLEGIRRSEERYAVAAAAANDGLWEYDVAADDLYISERGRALLGIDDAEPTLADWVDLVHPDDRLRVDEAIRGRAAHGAGPVDTEFRVAPVGSVARWLLLRAMGVTGPDGTVERIVGSLSDIDQRKQLEEQLRQAALYDTVTGLPNRRLFLERLSWAIEQAQRRDDARFAVVFLDLDGFKLINDSLGHLMGDELLKTIGDRLRRDLRSVDTAARFGGDEFAVLLYGLGVDDVLPIVHRIQERIAAPVQLGDHEVSVTASVGIASSETGYTSAEDVLRDADIAMYHAKESERGTASMFDPVMHTRATGRLRAQSELRTALLEEQFVVHYQPVVPLDGGALTHLEALVRWEHPERGIMLPGEFLPVMAETGTIVALGQWLVDRVCAQVAAWQRGDDGAGYTGPVTVSVNLSHREFWSEQLLPTVRQALDRHGVAPGNLVLEITESVIMSDPDAARQVMGNLRAIGVGLHIDDFGTGQSSLHALRSLPVDALKIDQSFIQQLDVDHQTTELVRIIVGMGRTLGLDVVAEGVETPEQAERLRTMGCATAQGWLYAKAVPGDEAGRMLGRPLAPRVDAGR